MSDGELLVKLQRMEKDERCGNQVMDRETIGEAKRRLSEVLHELASVRRKGIPIWGRCM